jgi:nucleolysin TIA-1/TIAR
MQPDRGFAFIKLDSHENAANAIVNLQGTMVHGRGLKCSWGKDRNDGGDGGSRGPPPGQYGGVSRIPNFEGQKNTPSFTLSPHISLSLSSSLSPSLAIHLLF